MMASWQDRAQQKREAILAAIPPEWRLKDLPSVEEKRDVTGDYMKSFLDEQEVQITETDAETIVAKTTSGEWKAEDVTRAFCHRAAIAHQLVRISKQKVPSCCNAQSIFSCTACTRFSSMQQSSLRVHSILTSQHMESQLALCTDYLYH